MSKAFIGLALLLIGAGQTWAVNPGDEVIVIYNTRVPESKTIAEHYAERRHVPASQLYGFALSTGDEMSRAEFRDSLQTPLAKAIAKQKLWDIRTAMIRLTNGEPKFVQKPVESKIRYAVLCYGIPFRINRDESLKEKEANNVRPELRRNEAAVDTELALLPNVEEHLALTGPLGNPLYGSTNESHFTATNGVLMVTRLDGPTAAIANALVDKAITAETNGLWGRAYIDIRNITDPGYKPGDDWLRTAAEVCRFMGFETLVDSNAWTFPAEYPMSQIAFYAGWYDNDVSGPFTRANVEFMPGAFAYHLHSYSAHALRSTTKNWVGPLLAKGVTITMGCVDEPYLGGTPDIGVFAARLMISGFTFGEAAYAAQPVLSWQTTIVGDPLYRPFGIPPQQLHESLVARKDPMLEWSFLRLVDLNIVRGTPLATMAAFIESIELTKSSAVLTEKLAEMYSTLGKPSSTIEMYERALKLKPSPEQKIRIRLALGEKLMSSEKFAEAAEDYGDLLSENPDYPGKIEVYRKLLPIAQKLGKKEAAANYEEKIKDLSQSAAK